MYKINVAKAIIKNMDLENQNEHQNKNQADLPTDLIGENRRLREKIASLEKIIDLNNEEKAANVRREENKDVDFGGLLSAAIQKNTSEYDILKLMTSGTKKVVGEGVDVVLYAVKDVTPEEIKTIMLHEKIEEDSLSSKNRALYCLIDTALGDRIDKLDKIDRYLSLKNGTVLGDTDSYGEGVVSVKELGGGKKVKNFHYADYSSWRVYHQIGDTSQDALRVSFPIYYIEPERLEEIQYILLVIKTGNIPFSNDLIRTIRGYGNYATLALALKQLVEKEQQLIKKDRLLEKKDQFIVSGIRRYLHNIVTPLSTIEYIVGHLNEIINKEYDHETAKKYSVLLEQINKVKDSLQRIRDTITQTKQYYQKKTGTPYSLIDTSLSMKLMELDGFIKEYIKTVDIEGLYGSLVDCKLQLNAGGKKVLIDPVKMSYLLDNAIKNTFEQCKAIDLEKVIFELKTIYNEQADTIVFFIRDDAGGMSEQQYNAYRSEGIIETTKQNGTGEGIPTILEYFKNMGCKDVELLNFPYDGIMYTATFSVKD